jgi:shikimate dehydrogenase
MSIQLGLIGYPLGHSLSPKIHQAALDALELEGVYRLYPISPNDADGLSDILGRVRSGDLTGVNVTIPHKQTVVPLLDSLTESAEAIGAVNTIYVRDGRLIGHNTDAPGFTNALNHFLGENAPGAGSRAIVLGSGGGARAVAYALAASGWEVTIAAVLMDQAQALVDSVNKSAAGKPLKAVPTGAESLAGLLPGIRLVVNASPVGMYPEVGQSPWPDGLFFPERACVYDLVYNPRETRLVRQARQAGLRASTGLGMLVRQAGLSFECWTGRAAPLQAMFAAVEE